LPDGSADVVTVAQAFHWFDLDRAIPELHRVLAPDGWLALLWNMRDLDDPLQRAVEELLRPYRGTVVSVRHGGWREPLAATPLFGEGCSREFAYEQLLTAESLAERVASTSFVANLEPDERDALLDRAR